MRANNFNGTTNTFIKHLVAAFGTKYCFVLAVFKHNPLYFGTDCTLVQITTIQEISLPLKIRNFLSFYRLIVKKPDKMGFSYFVKLTNFSS